MSEILKKVKGKLFKTKRAKKEKKEVCQETPLPMDPSPRPHYRRLVREYEDVRPSTYSHLFKPPTTFRPRTTAKSVAGGEDLDSDSEAGTGFVRNCRKRVSFHPHVREDEVDVLREKTYKLERDLEMIQRQLQFCSRRSVRFQKLYRSERETRKYLNQENQVLRKSFIELMDKTLNGTQLSIDSDDVMVPNVSCTGAVEGFASDGYHSGSLC
ncbi:unnamed protein product [Bursaphelenchus xylophilus]|uniref:(pine wood nematode) hypothetical protein n=1 Tax=Bursaphelenchus xylophilus TaxID=6326 RepID=A0A1I7SRU3_BURXY|nr:unnamed protein product [Bursaphelenchus xylophilus]CAG9101847.1 unnamed protein product [Bursaphelenchus xylophilus]